MLKFSYENIKIIPLIYIAFVLCTTGLPLYLSGYIFYMKKIPLTQGKFALVDDGDFDTLSKHTWYAWINKRENKKVWYAISNMATKNGGRNSIRMHRLLMGVTDPKIQVDHKDHNGLNNQRSNLRVCNNEQNASNRPKSLLKGDTSKYKGVNTKRYYTGAVRWIAQISVSSRKIHLGCFKSEIEAALAYNEGAKKYHGEFAYLNKI